MTVIGRLKGRSKLHNTRSTLHESTGFIETAPYIVINILSRLTLLTWYEKRKYWAARQAEVLEGLFDFLASNEARLFF